MNLDLMSDLYMAAVCAVVVVGWFAREIAAEIRVGFGASRLLRAKTGKRRCTAF